MVCGQQRFASAPACILYTVVQPTSENDTVPVFLPCSDIPISGTWYTVPDELTGL